MIQFRILALTALALVSVVPLAKPHPTLMVNLFSQPVSSVSWNSTVVLTSSSTYACSNGQTVPGTIVVTGVNFTENLAGRDPGSTWTRFRSLNTPIFIFNRVDFTMSLITSFLCGNFPVVLNAEQANLGLDSSWRVLSSGNYTLVSNYLTYPVNSFPTTAQPLEIITETWTLTTLS